MVSVSWNVLIKHFSGITIKLVDVVYFHWKNEPPDPKYFWFEDIGQEIQWFLYEEIILFCIYNIGFVVLIVLC